MYLLQGSTPYLTERVNPAYRHLNTSWGARGLKKCGIILMLAPLASCATDPAPNFIAGQYYMAGDKGCKRYQTVTPTTIMCTDSTGRSLGLREAMTPQQMQMYAAQQSYNAAQMQALNEQLQQSNLALQRATQAVQNSAPYTAPAVVNPAQPTSVKVTCIEAGIVVACKAK